MEYQILERRDKSGTWSVEAIDNEGDGDCFVTIFFGPNSEARAREYFEFKHGQQQAEFV